MFLIPVEDGEVPCGFKMDRGVISGGGGHDVTYLVQTTRGAFSMSLEELKGSRFVGALQVSSGKCSQVLEGLSECQGPLCNIWVETSVIVSVVLAVASLVALCLRTWYIKGVLRSAGFRGGSTSRRGLVVRQGPAKRLIPWAVLLLCKSMVETEACSNGKLQLISPTSFVMTLVPGETVCFKEGNVTLASNQYTYPLAHVYDTGYWSFKQEMSWGCASGACPSVDECEKMDHIAHAINHRGEGTMMRGVCRMYHKACTFGRGCWMGHQEVVVDEGMGASIYKVLPGFETPRVVTNMNCTLSFQQSGYVAPLTGAVYASAEHFFHCADYSMRGLPSFGELGDIQFLRNTTPAFPWNSLPCKTGWFDDQSCEVPVPFSSMLHQKCSRLPGPVGGIMSSLDKSGLHVNPNSALQITMTCPHTLTPTHRNNSCHDVRAKIWGSRNSGFGIAITASGLSQGSEGSTILEVQCSTIHKIELPCDGELRYYPLSEADDCFNITDTSTSLISVETYPLENIGGFDPRNGGSFSYTSMIGNPSIFRGVSMVSVAIGLLLLVVLLRR